ncbi:MAG TPA: cysteine desulfurase, partial [Candidatus Nanoarchaeia archaeon]|nr:cysteine desulfurase [Candidatus Nanoarchaeia archaeon]
MDIECIKKEFPILNREINGHKLVYLDSAATSQKPKQVIKSIVDYYENYNSNVHRGIYKLSEEATIAYENARNKIASLINASPEEVIFTKGTTESINMLSIMLSRNLKKDDEIILTEMEHHSNLVPWQIISKEIGLKLKFLRVSEEGKLSTDELLNLISPKTKIIAITHVSNVLGTVNPIKEISRIAHEHNILVAVDGAQSVPHMPIDIRSLDVDFFSFSGHKMLASTGIGVLYGKKNLLENLDPVSYGGGMINKVSLESSSWAELPWKFEAGTPNIQGAISMDAAISYLNMIGLEKIQKHEKELTDYAVELLDNIKGITLYGPKNKSGIISFNLEKVHPHDTAAILDSYGVSVRAGHHCAMPLMKALGINGTTRVSLYLYNSYQDIDILCNELKKVR